MYPVDNCGPTGTLISVSIEDCNGAPPRPCNAAALTHIEIDWSPKGNFDDGTFKMYAKTSAADFPLFEDWMCNVQHCPPKAGQISILRRILDISFDLWDALSG